MLDFQCGCGGQSRSEARRGAMSAPQARSPCGSRRRSRCAAGARAADGRDHRRGGRPDAATSTPASARRTSSWRWRRWAATVGRPYAAPWPRWWSRPNFAARTPAIRSPSDPSRAAAARAPPTIWLITASTTARRTFGAPVTTVVDDLAPGARLAWRGTGLGSRGYHAWILEPTAAGCRLIAEETQRGAVVWLGRPLLRRGLLAQHQRWLEGLARAAALGHQDSVPAARS